MEFFCMDSIMDDFDLEENRKKSLSIYNNQHKSYTKHDVSLVTWHRDRTSALVIEAIDEFARDNYKDIADIYLHME